MSKPKSKPCPFCGNEEVLTKIYQEGGSLYRVCCEHCTVRFETCVLATFMTNWEALHPEKILPIPCTNVREKTVKDWFQKLDEEINELKAAVLAIECTDEGYRNLANDKVEINGFIHDYQAKQLAEEAADTITAITSMLEAMGIDEQARQEAQRRVNKKNRERGVTNDEP